MATRKCGNCGKDMTRQMTTGPFPWKDFPEVFLSEAVELFKCEACGEHGILGNEAKKLDEEIQKSITSFFELAVNKVLEREECRQFDLAERLGITKSHLSAIKSGDKNISFQTFNFMKVMALNSLSFSLADPTIDWSQLAIAAESYTTLEMPAGSFIGESWDSIGLELNEVDIVSANAPSTAATGGTVIHFIPRKKVAGER